MRGYSNVLYDTFQLAKHNKELADLLRPQGVDSPGDQALEYYAKHTAQIEVLSV